MGLLNILRPGANISIAFRAERHILIGRPARYQVICGRQIESDPRVRGFKLQSQVAVCHRSVL